jgi:prepilin-type N-terminal cleavage/methylation domain-containing protein
VGVSPAKIVGHGVPTLQGGLGGRPLRAFSLAEMMIALAILAIGLLVIGAALPIGVRYTRDSVNIATGQAAAEHALDLIEQNVCLRRTILDPNSVPPRPVICEPGLFVPRQSDPADPSYPQLAGEFIPDYEPVIKVRPLFTRSIGAPASGGVWTQDTGFDGVRVESLVRFALLGNDTGISAQEHDPPGQMFVLNGAWMSWAIPSVATVYPPVTPDWSPAGTTQYLPDYFLANDVNKYTVWGVGQETRKVQDSLISWTAFYRRVSYDDPNTPTIDEGDPTLYEFIAVAVRRPSLKHRFPLQNAADGGMSTFGAPTEATLAPVPWLVTFDLNARLPAPPNGFNDNGVPLDGDNFPMPLGQTPATITFSCTWAVSGLFPVGSIFIPARNDVAPSHPDLFGAVPINFGPPAPTTLPIYEVVQRPNDTTVVVRYNGYYPRQGTGTTATPAPEQWPVWVIPPAFEELSGGYPVFPDRSPILAVARRYVRLRELP